MIFHTSGAEFDNCQEFIEIKNVSDYVRDPKSKLIFHISGAEFDNCTEFIQVNVSDYDTDPKSANDLSKRPLGFMSAVIPFKAINPKAKNPCFQITLDDSTKQTVQVLVSK